MTEDFSSSTYCECNANKSFGSSCHKDALYGTRSAIAILTGSSVVGKPVPIPLKMMALGNHLTIIAAMVALGSYMTTIDMSEKESIHSHEVLCFSDLGMH